MLLGCGLWFHQHTGEIVGTQFDGLHERAWNCDAGMLLPQALHAAMRHMRLHMHVQLVVRCAPDSRAVLHAATLRDCAPRSAAPNPSPEPFGSPLASWHDSFSVRSAVVLPTFLAASLAAAASRPWRWYCLATAAQFRLCGFSP